MKNKTKAGLSYESFQTFQDDGGGVVLGWGGGGPALVSQAQLKRHHHSLTTPLGCVLYLLLCFHTQHTVVYFTAHNTI